MERKTHKSLLYLLILIVMISCDHAENSVSVQTDLITDTGNLMKDISTLSSDDFEGRAPSTKGEEKTIAFLKKRFLEVGAEPGNNGEWTQNVPMVAIDIKNKPVLRFSSESNDSLMFSSGDNAIVWSKNQIKEQSVEESEVVFVGYGISAPEFGWNDYKGIDVKGKTVLILVNDPGYATQDSALFTGNAMTYYGRWTYKYEEAARQGATAAIIIHEAGAAGYPWEVVTGSWSGTHFGLQSEGEGVENCTVEGWINQQAARELFEYVGENYDSLIDLAKQKEFKAVETGVDFSTKIQLTYEISQSSNFMAKIPGTEFPDEYIIYSAHWDHLGKDNNLPGDDKIYNGAVDNATGTAGLISLAELFVANPPKRTVLFIAVTAEEQGLLGSAYYGKKPVYPLEKTVANINIDAMNVFGEMEDVVIIGYGNSELDDYVRKYAKGQDRIVVPEPTPEKGYFYRSDHFSFAKEGVPALYIESGNMHREKGKEWAEKQIEEHEANRYHKPADEVLDTWDISGMVQDLELVYMIGSDLAQSQDWPNWQEGVAFKAKRDQQRN